jgi:hypothetical protein
MAGKRLSELPLVSFLRPDALLEITQDNQTQATTVGDIRSSSTLVFNVMDFGAKGDAYQDEAGHWYGTDDAVAINNAIAMANFMGGGRVVTPPGKNFLINSVSVTLLSNVTLETAGWIVRSETVDVHLIAANDCTNVWVVDARLDGNNINNPFINVHIVRFHNCQNYGVMGTELRNSCGYTISSDVTCKNGRFMFNTITNSKADGIDVHNTGLGDDTLTICFNVIDGFGVNPGTKAGIHARGRGVDVSHNIVRNLLDTVTGNFFGILYGNGEDMRGGRITCNYVALGPTCLNGKGIGCHNSYAVVTCNTVQVEVGTYSAFVLQSPYIQFTFNTVTGLQTWGEDLDGSEDDELLYTGVSFSHGVIISPGADHCYLHGNIVQDVGGSGYLDQAIGTIFATNKALNCVLWGFDLIGSTGARLDAHNDTTNCTGGTIRRGTDTQIDQGTDPSLTPSFAQVLLTNPPTNPLHAVNKATLDAALTARSILGQSGTSVVLSGTNVETALATVTVPGGLMQPGDRLEIVHTQTHTASANDKQILVRLGGMTGTVFLGVHTQSTAVSSRFFTDICCGSTANSQSGWASNTGNFGQSGTAIVTATKDFSVDQDIVISGILSDAAVTAGESITLRNFSIRYLPAPR